MYRFIKFFVFDCDSFPYLLSLFFWSGIIFPLVALDKILREKSTMASTEVIRINERIRFLYLAERVCCEITSFFIG